MAPLQAVTSSHIKCECVLGLRGFSRGDLWQSISFSLPRRLALYSSLAHSLCWSTDRKAPGSAQDCSMGTEALEAVNFTFLFLLRLQLRKCRIFISANSVFSFHKLQVCFKYLEKRRLAGDNDVILVWIGQLILCILACLLQTSVKE